MSPGYGPTGFYGGCYYRPPVSSGNTTGQSSLATPYAMVWTHTHRYIYFSNLPHVITYESIIALGMHRGHVTTAHAGIPNWVLNLGQTPPEEVQMSPKLRHVRNVHTKTESLTKWGPFFWVYFCVFSISAFVLLPRIKIWITDIQLDELAGRNLKDIFVQITEWCKWHYWLKTLQCETSTIEFFTIRVSVILSDRSKVIQIKINFVKNCLQWGWNHGPLDHDSNALPTELGRNLLGRRFLK